LPKVFSSVILAVPQGATVAMHPRDIQIPLFLWIATALLVHLFWGGGTHQVAIVLEEKAALRSFAEGIQREVQAELRPIPIAMLESDITAPPQPAPTQEAEETDKPEADDQALSKEKPEKKDVTEEEKKKEKAEEKKKEKKPEPEKEPEKEAPKPDLFPPIVPEEKKPDALAEKPKQEPQQLELERKRAIAVRQHVEKENQPDNPDAKFLGDKANKVDEETQAKITSTDQDDPKPQAGAGASEGPASEQPGNADETRIASAFGDSDEGSALPSPHVEEPKAASPATRPETALQTPEQKVATAQSPQRSAAPKPTDPGQKAQQPDPGTEASPDIIAGAEGGYSLGGAAVPKPKKKRLPPVKATKPNDWFGLGSGALTSSGINLNLTHSDAIAVVGEKQIAEDRRMDRLRRRSQRKGTWKKVGLERWRSAIENYVPGVKPGNTTALNTAASPFAVYLNDIHNRIHPIFADTFLGSLSRLPASDPLNRPDLVAHIEIIVSKLDGSLVRTGVVKPSGVTAFDISALESILQASPFGTPPSAIVSPDGNVYLHWEFYRNPDFACSTYFAHPFLLKSAPTPNQPKPSPNEPGPNPLPGPRMPSNLMVPTGYVLEPRRNLSPLTL
jgi:hypothetical protein